MKVRVGNSIADGKHQFIMVYLTDKDKKNIGDMLPDAHVYGEFPDDVPPKYIKIIKLQMEQFKEECENENI